MQIRIKPGLRVAWRSPSSVQIGLDGRWGTVLDGMGPTERRLLTVLAQGHVVDPAARGRQSDVREHALVALLAESGVGLTRPTDRVWLAELGADRERLAPDAAAWSLVPGAAPAAHAPAPDDGWYRLAARRRLGVRIVGAGRVGATLAATLAAAGVGRLDIVDAGRVQPGDLAPAGAQVADLGSRRQDAVRAAITRAAGEARENPQHRPPELVVLIEPDAADAIGAQHLLADDVPHLSIVIREGSLIVGPLVIPGESACLRCLDLHRADRDPAWPRVLAQLLGGRAGDASGAVVAEETASAQLAASVAALQVLALLDGDPAPGGGTRRPASVSATLEIDLPEGLVSRREWSPHPACGCHGLPSGPTAATMAR